MIMKPLAAFLIAALWMFPALATSAAPSALVDINFEDTAPGLTPPVLGATPPASLPSNRLASIQSGRAVVSNEASGMNKALQLLPEPIGQLYSYSQLYAFSKSLIPVSDRTFLFEMDFRLSNFQKRPAASRSVDTFTILVDAPTAVRLDFTTDGNVGRVSTGGGIPVNVDTFSFDAVHHLAMHLDLKTFRWSVWLDAKLIIDNLKPSSPSWSGELSTLRINLEDDQTLANMPVAYVDNIRLVASPEIPASTRTSLAANPNPAFPGQSTTLTATITSETGTPAGLVEFFDGVTSLGTGTLDGSGQATLMAPALAVGTHPLSAVYQGEGFYLPSTGSASQVILSLMDPSVFAAGVVDHASTRFLQTTLMRQQLTVTNRSSQTLEAIRVTVHWSSADTGARIRLYNASGINSTGKPYLQHDYPVPPGGQVTMTAEFYSPDRVTVPTPTFTVELVPAEILKIPPGTPQAVLNTRMLAPDHAFLIDFKTVKGARYHILYSPDMLNWSLARPAVTGTGFVVQWVDEGPPKTQCLPDPKNVPARFYQVIRAD
ncbi:MAG: Ig-like domain repeat protein [Verrucomicrobiaceae bacterium]|nr:MAG: Ig-like domain repeat protein [Verrucomicrobiaceae bacterium]